MRHAPPQPTTQELAARHSLTEGQRTAITLKRQQIGATLLHPGSSLLVIMGPCALTDSPRQITHENSQLNRLATIHPGIVVVQRLCTWKPRTDPNAWHGMESTPDEVERAYSIVIEQAGRNGNVGMEVGYSEHHARYHGALALAWIGARNNGDTNLLHTAALNDPGLPIAIKNGLDGNLSSALQRVKYINDTRDSSDAPAVLLYRGGTNAMTPKSWEEQCKEAVERTEGRVIIDFAHGSEMAHDPNGNGEKSIEGQLAAFNHGLELAAEGYIPAGIMLEASDTQRVVDPNMPQLTGLMCASQLNAVRQIRELITI